MLIYVVSLVALTNPRKLSFYKSFRHLNNEPPKITRLSISAHISFNHSPHVALFLTRSPSRPPPFFGLDEGQAPG